MRLSHRWCTRKVFSRCHQQSLRGIVAHHRTGRSAPLLTSQHQQQQQPIRMASSVPPPLQGSQAAPDDLGKVGEPVENQRGRDDDVGALHQHQARQSTSAPPGDQMAKLTLDSKATPTGAGPSKKDKKKAKEAASNATYPLEITPRPDFFDHRQVMFDRLKKEYDEEMSKKPREKITITMPDGSTKEGVSYETTPLEIAQSIAKSLAEKVVIAKVDDSLWDLERPFEGDARLRLLTFEDDEGRYVFWHSSAHVLGEAAERHYGCHLCIGPPVDDGFFYEMAISDRVVREQDYDSLNTLAKSAIKEKQKFERLVVSKENLLKMFAYNKYKVHIINSKIADGTSTTVYRCGPMIDLCVGPHVPHTGRIKVLEVMKNSSSYFLGDAANDSLQRIYGVSFPDTKQMTEHKMFLAEAAKRDHRKIGQEQDLFFFSQQSPGSCFFLPHGARIYNTLIEMMRKEYQLRGFQEVITPNMFNVKLWESSGHWDHYKDDMFVLDVEKDKFALKPMNCPSHCVIFNHRERSYRELPWRVADFGVLHRNEASGALTGLTRVRRFQQDDAHIFCLPEQIAEEIRGQLELLQKIYGIFGFEFRLTLSTRPEKFLGDIDTWNKAEAMLESVMEEFHPGKWRLNPGDGAFYGPKIDVQITDALRRSHQCATIQLDFQLPQRFQLQVRGKEMPVMTDSPPQENSTHSAQVDSMSADPFAVPPGYVRPVMIHRAVLGSLERIIAILTEHYGGRWPFWLSPRQCIVIPVSADQNTYAQAVSDRLQKVGFYSVADKSGDTLNKKIRNAELERHNFILTVGRVEQESDSVNVRNRDDAGTKVKGATKPVEEVITRLLKLKEAKLIDSRSWDQA